MNSLKIILSILITGTLIVSCKSTKKVAINQQITKNKEVILLNQTDSIIGKMTENQFDFEWLSAKFSADYEVENNNTSFNGQIRIRKDSLIWITISKFSIEGIRILITQDSVFVINRMDDSYFKSDFNYINRFINNAIDFDMLQAFIIGNDFKYYENDKFKSDFDGTDYHLITVNRHKLKKYIKNENENLKILVQNITLNSNTYKIKHLTVKEVKANNKLEIQYGKFENTGNQLFPNEISITINAEKTILVNINFSKITFNEPLNFPFKIPDNYQKIIPK